MPESRPAPVQRPLWARATSAFAAPSFDVRSRRDFAGAMREFVTLPPGEQTFHQTHLLFRGVQALEGVHALLERIERRLVELDPAALRHLGPLRAAAEELLEGQEELLDALVERAAPRRDHAEEAPDLILDERPPEDEPVLASPKPGLTVVPPEEVEVLEPAPAPRQGRRRGAEPPPEAA